MAAGAILVGGTAAYRAIHASADHDAHLTAVHDRTTAVAASEAERYVLNRSAKLASIQPTPAMPSILSAVVGTAPPPAREPDFLPPLARAEFLAAPALADVAGPEPVETAETQAPLAETEAPAAAALASLAAAAPDYQPPIVPAVLLTPLHTGSSIALASQTRVRQDPEQPHNAKQKSKPQQVAETKKRRSADTDNEVKISRRPIEPHYVPPRARDYAYAAPIRVDFASKWRVGTCSGGPARWVGNRIYWGSRC